ncbi:amidohydrolase [Sphingomonas koreensis]|jgi:predicted TIM-barrel fold metal-dependent hydrolase|uniref:Amidohydrolase n=1 Tax=Sphingomonas koreensis TaxID=93064 RepID=A0A1L6J5T8_9SPHN|nr:amidohydrolase family protein [Sphingomonas koreensis]APR51279.1 amidohydrolase [Sphingomonas koreensis]MDC7810389.1 amidohydrolase family protein [Sphingomonas koreensis]RSU17567.1 amidohydrolase [Sphingomonas koreensis]RSU21823.1 amidohydrolase [Sphingomonas koreensis]RSU26190.1 amidohydrolase [Sphingomonas koreensis]
MSQRPPLVDPHVHLWDLAHIRYPWLTGPFDTDNPNGSVERIAVDYPLDAYLADAQQWDVRGIVHIDAGADPADALKETQWLQAMADTRGMPSGIVAFAALDDPQVETLLSAHVEHANVCGIRHIVNWHPDPARSYSSADVTTTSAWMRGFGLLKKFDLSFDLQAYPGQFAHLAALIAKHPDTQVILNHTGMAIPGDADGWETWRRGMAAFAALPNVAVKISGMGFTWRPWDVDRARAYVLETIDLFGTDRAMFASNFPTDKLFGSFDTHFDAYDAITADFGVEERAALFGGNANRIYRLGLTL